MEAKLVRKVRPLQAASPEDNKNEEFNTDDSILVEGEARFSTLEFTVISMK